METIATEPPRLGIIFTFKHIIEEILKICVGYYVFFKNLAIVLGLKSKGSITFSLEKNCFEKVCNSKHIFFRKLLQLKTGPEFCTNCISVKTYSNFQERQWCTQLMWSCWQSASFRHQRSWVRASSLSHLFINELMKLFCVSVEYISWS